MDASSTAERSGEGSSPAFQEATTRSPDGLLLRYVVAGAGQPLLLLHPFSDALESWWDIGLAGRLARAGRVIALDARGHGGSDKPPEPGRYGLEHRVADVLAEHWGHAPTVTGGVRAAEAARLLRATFQGIRDAGKS